MSKTLAITPVLFLRLSLTTEKRACHWFILLHRLDPTLRSTAPRRHRCASPAGYVRRRNANGRSVGPALDPPSHHTSPRDGHSRSPSCGSIGTMDKNQRSLTRPPTIPSNPSQRAVNHHVQGRRPSRARRRRRILRRTGSGRQLGPPPAPRDRTLPHRRASNLLTLSPLHLTLTPAPPAPQRIFPARHPPARPRPRP